MNKRDNIHINGKISYLIIIILFYEFNFSNFNLFKKIRIIKFRI